jgi:hypothetical protein
MGKFATIPQPAKFKLGKAQRTGFLNRNNGTGKFVVNELARINRALKAGEYLCDAVAIERAIQMRADKVQIKLIAAAVFRSVPWVSTVINRHAPEIGKAADARRRPGHGQQRKILGREALLDAYNSDATLKQIGLVFKCSRETVRRSLKHYGISPQHRRDRDHSNT